MVGAIRQWIPFAYWAPGVRPARLREATAWPRAQLRKIVGRLRIDPEGVVHACDPALLRVLGYTRDELKGAFLFAYIHARDLAPILKDMADLVQRREESAFWTFRFRASDGHWCGFRARAERSRPGVSDDCDILLTLFDRRSVIT